VLCVAAACRPSVAGADDWTAFVPRPVENGAYLDTFTSYERDDSRSGGQPIRWHDTFFREKLTLYSNGYSYHPRFLRYQFSISGLLKQEDFEASYFGPLGWRQGSSLEYDARLFLLPEHPYNLRLFASRYEPLFKEQVATLHNAVENSRGASFRYRRKPYFFHASYVNDTIDSAGTSTDVTRVGVDGEYFRRFRSGNELGLTGAFNPAWFSTSEGLTGNSTEYLLGNFVDFRRLRLSSNLARNVFDQEGRGGETFSNEQFSWYEVLSGYLPWNFRSTLSYRYQDNKSTIEEPTVSRRNLSEIDRDIQFDLVHRLYESLDTSYSLLHDARTSSGGDTTSLSQALALTYTKSIPHGRLMLAGNGGRSETENRGQTSVPNETHSGVSVPGSFALNQRTVQPGSIIVYLRSPLPPFDLILLEENVHYEVRDIFTIDVITLPPPFIVPGTYDFVVFYSLVGGEFALRTDTYGANASVQLFDDLLTPYVGFAAVRSTVTSGVFAGIPIDSSTYTYGLLCHRGPVRLRGEYQELNWDVSPSRAWRAEAQYVAALTPTTTVYATAGYLNKRYPRGTSGFAGSVGGVGPFTEETETVSASVQKQLLRGMSLAAGGSYSHLEGLINGNAYTANGSWNWTIGKVDMSLGVSAYGSDARGITALGTRREHELVYLRLRRQLY